MGAHFVVSFGPNQSYYFNNGRKSIWKDIPEGLSKLLQDDVRFTLDKVKYVSLGLNAAYFIKSSEASAWGNVPPRADGMVKDLGGWNSIQWIMFTPDPNACLILDVNGQVFGQHLSQEFYSAILRYAFYGFQDISLGVNGGFALSTKNNMVYYKGMPDEFVKAWKSGSVAEVTTSTFDPFYFIEFKDGSSAYWCPSQWHSAIDELRNAVPITSTETVTTSGTVNATATEAARHTAVMTALSSFATGTDKLGRPTFG